MTTGTIEFDAEGRNLRTQKKLKKEKAQLIFELCFFLTGRRLLKGWLDGNNSTDNVRAFIWQKRTTSRRLVCLR